MIGSFSEVKFGTPHQTLDKGGHGHEHLAAKANKKRIT